MKRMKEKEIMAYMSFIRKPGKKVYRWLTEEVNPSYLLYDKDVCSCSHCGQIFPREKDMKLKTGRTAKCPKCGHKVIARNKTYGYGMYDAGKALVVENYSGRVVLRYFKVISKYSSASPKPLVDVYEFERNIFNADNSVLTFDRYSETAKNAFLPPDAPRDERWYDCPLNAAGQYITHCHQERGEIKLYPNADKTLEGSKWEHCMLKTACRVLGNHVYLPFCYLNAYTISPLYEYLFKMGMKKLARALNEERYNLNLDFSAKTAQGIMRITREQLKVLKGNQSIELLKLYNKGYGISDAARIVKKGDGYEFVLSEIQKKLPKFKCSDILDYLDKGNDKGLLEDYLRMAKELGFDLSKRCFAFPQDLKKSHDMMVALRLEKETEEEAKQAKEAQKIYRNIKVGLEKQFSFCSGGLCIVIPQSTMAIAREGMNLHHCVGTYIPEVCSEKTVILFVRKKDEIDKSYYTMEVRNGRMIQCRGLQNCGMTEEVKNFVNMFMANKQLTL